MQNKNKPIIGIENKFCSKVKAVIWTAAVID